LEVFTFAKRKKLRSISNFWCQKLQAKCNCSCVGASLSLKAQILEAPKGAKAKKIVLGLHLSVSKVGG